MLDWLAAHPVLPLAVRAALAAVVAWLVVVPFGGIADDYPYYAPFGAVVAVSATVAGSLRTALQTVVALVVGALLGLACGALLQLPSVPVVVGVGLIVLLGTLLGAVPWFGLMGSWVPISALFILILGGDSPWHFGSGYLVLTTVGALTGGLVTLALPPLRLAEAAHAQDRLRVALVAQLESLAEGLRSDPLPSSDDWGTRREDMESDADRVRSLLGGATEGPRINWRVRRWQHRADLLSAQGRALAALAVQIGDLADLVATLEHSGREVAALGSPLRGHTADALRGTARALDSVDGGTATSAALADGLRSVDGFAAAVRDQRERTDDDMFAAGALVTALRRALFSVEQA